MLKSEITECPQCGYRTDQPWPRKQETGELFCSQCDYVVPRREALLTGIFELGLNRKKKRGGISSGKVSTKRK